MTDVSQNSFDEASPPDQHQESFHPSHDAATTKRPLSEPIDDSDNTLQESAFGGSQQQIRHDKTRTGGGMPHDAATQEHEPPSGSGPTSTEADGHPDPFAKVIFGDQSSVPSDALNLPVTLPVGGPLTEDAAKQHTRQSSQHGRSGAHRRKSVIQWEPTEAAKSLSDEFKTMVHGDYGKRCQICGTTFRMRNGELQTFVVHVVEPSSDSRTNHLGDLMGLCGQHYALVRYGDRTWLNPKTEKPFEDSEEREAWEHWKSFVLSAEGTDAEKTDDDGNAYIGLPIRFWNIYEEWNAEPDPVDLVVRYNEPHWKYLCELLKT